MNVKIGKRQTVSLTPVGTLLVGCRGKVLAEGSVGTAQLWLVGESVRSATDVFKVTIGVNAGASPSELDPNPVWKIVTTTIDRRFEDLDKERFLQLLMEVANA